MIEKIEIKNVPSCFDSSGILMTNLKGINYIYGVNGSGKTTVSNIIRSPSRFPMCAISWKNSISLKTLVYNKNFIDENFHQDIKGIFTLGKESHVIQEAIKTRKAQADKIMEDIINLRETLEQKKNEDQNNDNEYEENCWKLKLKYDNQFSEAFQGLRNSKSRFKERCKLESKNTAELLSFEELISLASTIFGEVKEKVNLLNKIDYGKLNDLENDQIFSTKIVGREDINISRLIMTLNNSDWVKQGYQYYKLTNGVCPFCQQQTSEEFKKMLEDYFDNTYIEQTSRVKTLIEEYNLVIESILMQIGDILEKKNEFFDADLIEQQRRLILSRYQTNKILLEKKFAEPSIIVKLESYNDYFKVIDNVIKSANEKILKHNTLVENITTEKRKLNLKVWRFITAENKADYERYITNLDRIRKAIDGINKNINEREAQRLSISKEIQTLEEKITSIIPTITDINRILSSFGFLSFKLAEGETPGSYRIVRENGENAMETLSEGEKTFITFLYFYHLLKGSNDKDSITINKVVVFDDPICSLDSNVLFIVSNLIRGIIDDLRSSRGYIKQIFILTHNIYFHKEITYNKRRNASDRMADETFWILRKKGLVSEIESYDVNPIKSSYELLWQELKNGTERDSITIQNTMRRIIENYFKILGHVNDDDLINKFDSEERVMCKSLMSWVNDGSHFIYDDLFLDCSPDTTARYLEVFKKIFALTENIGHYNMMMGIR